MTKNANPKSFAMNLWADKVNRSYPEGGGGGIGSSLYRNPHNETFQYLQGNTSGNGVEGSSTSRNLLKRFDAVVLQWKWPAAHSAETTYMGQLRTAAPHLKIMMYTDPRFVTDGDYGGGGTTSVVRTVLDTPGAPARWKAENAANAWLAHRFNYASSRATNMTDTTSTNTAGNTFVEEWWDQVWDYFQVDLYDGIMIDDMNLVGCNMNVYGVNADVNWDYRNVGTNDNFLSDATFKAAFADGMAACFAEFRARHPSLLLNINSDPGYWYRQTEAGGCPERPFSSHPYYQNDDLPFMEGAFEFGAGFSEFGRTDEVYPFKSFFSLTSFFHSLEYYRQAAKPAVSNLMGAAVAFAHGNLSIGDTASPGAITYAHARARWALGKLVGVGYATSRSGSVPFPIDEICIDLGAPVSSLSMGTLDESAAPATFTLRAPNFENGTADFHWAEYANALVVVRTDTTGLTLGTSNFGDGSAVSCTLPSAGSGYQWDEFNAATYVHPLVADLAMQSQDTGVNSGAANITSVSLKPIHAKAFRRVASGGGGGGTEVAPAFRASSSDATDNAGETTAQAPRPTGTVSGDLVVLAALVTNNSTAGSWGAITWPAGFTERDSTNADAAAWNRLAVATKVAGGSEPSTYDVTYTESGGPYRVVAAAVSYSAPNATPVEAVDAQNNPSNTASVVAPSLTPANANEKRLVTIYAISDGNATTNGRSLAPPGGQTERVEVVAGSGDGNPFSRLMIADEVYASASATGTRSAAISGGDCESMAISLLLTGKVP